MNHSDVTPYAAFIGKDDFAFAFPAVSLHVRVIGCLNVLADIF